MFRLPATKAGEVRLSRPANLPREMRLDLADEPRSIINQASVKLQQRGAGFDLFERSGRAIDAADADQRDLAARCAINASQHDRRSPKYGTSRKAAGFLCLRVLQAVTRQRRVGDGNAVDAVSDAGTRTLFHGSVLPASCSQR